MTSRHLRENRMNKYLSDKKFRIVLIVEAILIIFAVATLFYRPKGIDLSATSFSAGAGIYDEANDCMHIEPEIGWGPTIMQTVTFPLKRGVYEFHFYSKAEADRLNGVKIEADEADYEAIQTNTVYLSTGVYDLTYKVYVRENCNNLRVIANWAGQGSLDIYGASLVGTNIYSRQFLAIILALSIFTDVMFVLAINGFWTRKRIDIFALLSVCFVISSVPLMKNYIFYGADIIYHLIRIDEMWNALSSFQFPVRIFPDWLFGYGYADAVMYGNVLLVVPAVLRGIGFSVTTTYTLFEALVNLATVFTAYFCFKEMFKSSKAGILCAYIYALMPYRFYCLYVGNSTGTYLAAIFWPLLVLGMYRIFAMDVQDKRYQFNFIMPTIAISGLIGNHLLSTELAAYFIVFTCIILIKRTFTGKRFLELFKTLVASMIVNMWYIIPFLDMYRSEDFAIKHFFARTIQHRGLVTAQLFTLFVNQGEHTFFGDDGMLNCTNMTTGLPLMLGLLFFIWVCFAKAEKRNDRILKTGVVFSVIAVLSMWMSTVYFPWDYIQHMNGLFYQLVSSIQFSTRFLIIAGIALTVVGGCAYYLVKDDKKIAQAYLYIMAGAAVIAALYNATEILDKMGPVKLYDIRETGVSYVAGGEYVPYVLSEDVNAMLTYRDPSVSDNVEMSAYSKDGIHVTFDAVNNSDSEGYVMLPLLNYKGYKAVNKNTKEKLNITTGSLYDVVVTIPAGYNGTVETKYVGMWYWRVADVVSLIAIVLIGMLIISQIKDKKSAPESE